MIQTAVVIKYYHTFNIVAPDLQDYLLKVFFGLLFALVLHSYHLMKLCKDQGDTSRQDIDPVLHYTPMNTKRGKN